MCRFGKPIELGAQWIHGGCEGNPVYDLALAHRLVGKEMDETKTKNGEEAIQARVIFNEKMYSSSGEMISPEASTAAAEIYGDILDSAQNYFEGSYKTNRTRYPLIHMLGKLS